MNLMLGRTGSTLFKRERDYVFVKGREREEEGGGKEGFGIGEERNRDERGGWKI